MNCQLAVATVLALAGLLLTGCIAGQAWDPSGQTPRVPPEEVFKVVCAYQPPYWKNYHPEVTERIEGFKFNLYLVSRKTNKGVHTQGLLQTRMFTRHKLPDGKVQRTEVCSWTQSLTDTPRTTREYELGWAYQPHYYWGEADVQGMEVEVVVWYESPTGRKVYARPQFLKVPPSG